MRRLLIVMLGCPNPYTENSYNKFGKNIKKGKNELATAEAW
jgi:hypothetical protein